MPSQWKFGQTRAADAVPGQNTNYDDRVFVRTFKDGTTQIRIAPCETVVNGKELYGADAWHTQWEHFDPALRMSYPCIRDQSPDCKGCNHPSERVRKANKYYYVNAFDKDNRLRVFKFGFKVWSLLQSRQERLTKPENRQPLSDRDILVTRMGKNFNEITYDIDWGEKYPVDWPEELHDIEKILADNFDEAMQKYAEGEPTVEEEPAEEEQVGGVAALSEPAREKGPAVHKPSRRAGKSIYAGSNGQTTATNAEEASQITAEGHLGEIPTEDQLMDADTNELKRWLKETAKVDYPATAPRSRLIKIAKETLAIPF